MTKDLQNRFVKARRQYIANQFKDLNPMQKEAVLTTEGPVKAMLLLMALCFAGAIAGHIFLSNNRKEMEKGKEPQEKTPKGGEEEEK